MWVHSDIETHRKLVIWKSLEKQGGGTDPNPTFTSYFSTNSTCFSPEHGKWMLASQWLAQDIHWKRSWTFFPLAPDNHSKKSWVYFVYSILGTGKDSIFPVGQNFILFESDWFSEKCVFIKEDMTHGKENPKHLTLSYNLSYSLVSYGWRPRGIIKVGARGQPVSQLQN